MAREKQCRKKLKLLLVFFIHLNCTYLNIPTIHDNKYIRVPVHFILISCSMYSVFTVRLVLQTNMLLQAPCVSRWKTHKYLTCSKRESKTCVNTCFAPDEPKKKNRLALFGAARCSKKYCGSEFICNTIQYIYNTLQS